MSTFFCTWCNSPVSQTPFISIQYNYAIFCTDQCKTAYEHYQRVLESHTRGLYLGYRCWNGH